MLVLLHEQTSINIVMQLESTFGKPLTINIHVSFFQ